MCTRGGACRRGRCGGGCGWRTRRTGPALRKATSRSRKEGTRGKRGRVSKRRHPTRSGRRPWCPWCRPTAVQLTLAPRLRRTREVGRGRSLRLCGSSGTLQPLRLGRPRWWRRRRVVAVVVLIILVAVGPGVAAALVFRTAVIDEPAVAVILVLLVLLGVMLIAHRAPDDPPKAEEGPPQEVNSERQSATPLPIPRPSRV